MENNPAMFETTNQNMIESPGLKPQNLLAVMVVVDVHLQKKHKNRRRKPARICGCSCDTSCDSFSFTYTLFLRGICFACFAPAGYSLSVDSTLWVESQLYNISRLSLCYNFTFFFNYFWRFDCCSC